MLFLFAFLTHSNEYLDSSKCFNAFSGKKPEKSLYVVGYFSKWIAISYEYIVRTLKIESANEVISQIRRTNRAIVWPIV